MDNRPIGIYDSGVGGLTGLRALRQLLPEESFVFFGDIGRMPYGARSLAELRRIAVQDMDFLASHGVKAILAACGTISSAAHAEIAAYPIPAFGVLHPAVEAMAAVEGDGALGILATPASIASGLFTEPLRARCPGREIVGLPCPAFAPLIEQGHIDPDDPLLLEAVEDTLAPLQGRRFDALLLGCTHYGFIAEAIRRRLGDTPLLAAADCGAEALARTLREKNLLGSGGELRFYVSHDPTAFNAIAARCLGLETVQAAQNPIMEL